jgi:hypothetical protein
MSRGDGLEPAIRELVEGLADADKNRTQTRPVTEPDSSAEENQSSQTPDGTPSQMSETEGTQQPKSSQENEKPAVSKPLLSTDSDQLPNVLGLRRQDRS